MDQENSIDLTKAAFVSRESGKAKDNMRKKQLAGLYGNYFKHWPTVESCLEDYEQGRYKGHLWLSQSEKPYGPVIFDIKPKNLKEEYKKFVGKGIDPKYVTIAQCPPTDWIILNAEAQLTPEGLKVIYSKKKMTHRDAFNGKTETLTGLNAKLLLQKHMDEASYEGIVELLDTHSEDGSYSYTLEIHCFDRNLGTIAGRNTVIGEVRNY